MFAFLSANLGTIIVLLVLGLIVGLIIRGQLKDRAMGKSSCGSNCSHCQMAGSCHQPKHKTT
ncbi:MAG: FeoB-associated Cys-rich membrane protein [Firmicutes bacterium]|nr:FeoB-associated Cys-rich membrane protein [Bacillota bacterium]